MVMPKLNRKQLILLVAAVVTAVATLLWSQPFVSNKTTPSEQPSTSIESSNFDYPRPDGWIKLSQTALKDVKAESGLGHGAPPPIGLFLVSVDTSTSLPKNNDDLKNQALKTIPKNIELISSGDTTISDQPAIKLTYKITGSQPSKNEVNVVVYNKKIYYLLVTAAEKDFDSQRADFDRILTGFKFK
ncbi:hypothetical protein A3F65_02675 [Candidatus Saccharibacteria bacterium RIFCSPHIGHO2_12_FULL_47_16b]|nr:MAG: hypothetical protein A3F65_02675 [Candidatus Saccharibacteria bacterium RIFCSPHIGHO2_12_FULL_47_16b]